MPRPAPRMPAPRPPCMGSAAGVRSWFRCSVGRVFEVASWPGCKGKGIPGLMENYKDPPFRLHEPTVPWPPPSWPPQPPGRGGAGRAGREVALSKHTHALRVLQGRLGGVPVEWPLQDLQDHTRRPQPKTEVLRDCTCPCGSAVVHCGGEVAVWGAAGVQIHFSPTTPVRVTV